VLSDGAVLVAAASVSQLLADAALEEALASFAADHPIMSSCRRETISILE
jgi:hypothetical protein